MDRQIVTYIFGLASLFIGAAIVYRLLRRSPGSVNKLRSNKVIMIPLSLVLIGNGLYDLANPDSGRYSIGDEHWTAERKKVFIETCLRDASTMAGKYPEKIRAYCECSIEKLSRSQKYSEYVDNLKKPPEEQLKILAPIVKDCYDIMRTQVQIESSK